MLRGWWLVLPALLALAVVVPTARAGDKDDVDRAVEKGVIYLKRLQRPDGAWTAPLSGEAGMTALAILALVEAGVPLDDPVLQRAIQQIREAAVITRSTYSISLCILVLDRLRDKEEDPLIHSLAARLLAGQGSTGGWTYYCPSPSDEEIRRLVTVVKQRNILQGRTELPRDAPPGKRVPPEPPRDVQLPPNKIQDNFPQPGAGALAVDRDDGLTWKHDGDNSNTQFATLALWVARRHAVPVDEALKKIDKRFRISQNADGGWSYQYWLNMAGVQRAESLPSMTCAGLLGLAVARGPAAEKNKEDTLDKDAEIKRALLAISTCIGDPVGKNQRAKVGAVRLDGGAYYFLWSLERVAMAMGLDTIGKKDWYGWGTELLLFTQQADGSWQGEYGSYGADTCFAILFLRRANFASDLTRALRGRVSDPGERVLESGGVGGKALQGKSDGGMKSIVKPGPAPEPSAGGATPAPAANPEAEAARLGTRLVEANPEQQTAALDQLKAGSGSAFTQALASAIPRLEGDFQKKARQALADRLSGMKAATLRVWLKYEDREIRRAAALACAMKDDKTHVPDLIPLLEDEEPLVARAAYAALKSLSGQDLGPAADAPREERAKAVAAWKEWWKKNGS